jgi:hypothetical protein
MSRSIDNIVLLESNVNKLKSLIVKLKTEMSVLEGRATKLAQEAF